MNHAPMKLATAVSWGFIETKCGEVYSEGPGMPPLPTRLMAGLAILKHTFNLSDEELCSRWIENPHIRPEQSSVSSHDIDLPYSIRTGTPDRRWSGEGPAYGRCSLFKTPPFSGLMTSSMPGRTCALSHPLDRAIFRQPQPPSLRLG